MEEALFLDFFKFYYSLVPVSIISIHISFLNPKMFYFRSLLTLCLVSLPLISLIRHGVTLTLFPKFRYLHEKMFHYLDEKMYLGRLLFPLATIFLQYLLVIICLGWIELTSNRFHLSHSYERICPSGGSISRIWSRFGVGVRSFLWNRSVRNGRVLGKSLRYFHEASRRLSTGREWDWHAPDACWHVTARNIPQEFGFHSLLWFIPHFSLTLD